MHPVWPAALVHAFTALGAVCALLAVRAVIAGAWETVFVWLGIALVIDGIDGTFARLAKVSEHLPRFSGERLDLVVDYLTYVFVPALALVQAGYLPGALGLLLAALILLSSLFHFADSQSKSDDNCFVGFPAIWNAVAFYAFAFEFAPVTTEIIVAAGVVATFFPLKWIHPARTERLFAVTAAVVGLWTVAATATLWQGFPAPLWAQGLLALAVVYAVAFTVTAGRAR